MIITDMPLNDRHLLLQADPPNNFTNAGGDFTLQDRLTVLGHPDKMVFDVMDRVWSPLIIRHTMSSVKDIITENTC
jgi:hypothetical protein